MTLIPQSKNEELKVPKAMLFLSFFLLAAFTVFVVLHFAEAEKFVQLLYKAEPKWLILAVVLQIGTYFCAGFIWNMVIRNAGHQLPLSILARLSIEKLSIDQLVPTGGMSGNLIVVRTMRRFGLPSWLAIEAVVIDIISHYITDMIMAVLALSVLWFNHNITNIIWYLVAVFTVIVIIIPTSIFWLLSHKDGHLPSWLLRFKFITNISQTVKMVSPERILLPNLLGGTTLLNISIFFLDACTLWAMIRITNYSTGILTAIVAIVLATIAGAVSFLPGGMGGFEAGSVMVLVLFDVPIEVALTSTLLFRGMTLWIPLIPGVLLTRYDTRSEIRDSNFQNDQI